MDAKTWVPVGVVVAGCLIVQAMSARRLVIDAEAQTPPAMARPTTSAVVIGDRNAELGGFHPLAPDQAVGGRTRISHE